MHQCQQLISDSVCHWIAVGLDCIILDRIAGWLEVLTTKMLPTCHYGRYGPQPDLKQYQVHSVLLGITSKYIRMKFYIIIQSHIIF